ncbi:MAG: hypothetical protein M9933_00475 [Chitinophagaceae bacterium]|nr:hypothetical protein [Chitinophagaceae bacterium]
MNTSHRIYAIAAIALLVLYSVSCKKTDIDPLNPSYSQTRDLNGGTTQTANFKIKSNQITKTEQGYEFTGELLTQSDAGESFAVGTGDFAIDTAADGSVKAIRGVSMVEFPDVGVFGEMQKTFAWEKIKAHIEYQPGQYYIDTYHTELPLGPDTWYLHFKPFDETQGSAFELKQKLNSLVYHFADFYLDPLDPSFLAKADISMPDDAFPDDLPGYAGVFLNHVTQGLNDNNPVSFKAMIGISNQGLFTSKAYEFPALHKDFFKSKYGMNSFEASPSNYFVKMDEPGIPVPYTEGLLNIVGEEYLHQPAIMTKLGDFSQGSLLDYLNNSYKGGYMLDFNGKLRFGGNEYFSAILNGLGAINDIVGKDVFNTDVDLDLAQASLQIQFPGTVGDADKVPSYFRFGGMTKVPLATEIFGEEIRKYIPVFPPPATRQFFYVSAGPSKEDCSIYLEGGAKVHVPGFGDMDLGNAYFYVSLDGIEMGAASDIDAGPFHIDGDIKGSLSTKGFSLNMETNSDFVVGEGIRLGSSHLKINASSDDGLTFNGDIKMPYGLGSAGVKGKITNGKVSFSGKVEAGAQLNLPGGVQLPTANMKVSFDESEGFSIEGEVNVPYVGWASIKGQIYSDGFSMEGGISAGGIKFGSVTLPFVSGTILISDMQGVSFGAKFSVEPFGKVQMNGDINPHSIAFDGTGDLSLPVAGQTFNIASCKVIANSLTGVTLNGKIDLGFTKMQVFGFYTGSSNFSLSGSSEMGKDGFKLSLAATITASKISLTGSGEVAGQKVGVDLTPDWGNKSLKVCFNLLGNHCITF